MNDRVSVSATSDQTVGTVPSRLMPAWITTGTAQTFRRFWAATVLILLLGAGLRLIGLFDDFWLDEIWSWLFAREMKSAGAVFYKIHHDNNHYLNTLWMYVVGVQPHWYVYRLHSFASGLLTIIGCGLLTGDVAFSSIQQSLNATNLRKKTSTEQSAEASRVEAGQFARAASLVAMLLLATCNFASIYSTEARGYAMAGAAAVFSTWVLRLIVIDAKSRVVRFPLILVYVGLVTIGFLSHLTFICVYLPQLIWSTYQFLVHRCFLPAFACHPPVFLLIAGLWLFDLQYAQVGGANTQSPFWIGFESLALPFGAIDPEWLVLLCAGVIAGMLVFGIQFLFRMKSPDASLFALLFLCSPPLILLMRSDGLISTRHFFVVWMTLFPVLAIAVTQLATREKGKLPVLPLIILIGWMTTNGWEIYRFAQNGRGGFQRSAEWLVAEALKKQDGRTGPQSVGSDHDFRNQLTLSFYMRKIPNFEILGYLPQGSWPPNGVDWLFTHSFDRNFQPEPTINIGTWRYELAHFEPYSGVVGWHWAIYRRAE